MEFLYPAFSLVMLTFVIGYSLGISRFVCSKNGSVDSKYFRLFSGETPPEYVTKFERNLSNLLEFPLLFYILCLIAIFLKINDQLLLAEAWIFVGIRFAHTMVHVTYNNPLHRFFAFLLSSTLLLIMWIQLLFIASS